MSKAYDVLFQAKALLLTLAIRKHTDCYRINAAVLYFYAMECSALHSNAWKTPTCLRKQCTKLRLDWNMWIHGENWSLAVALTYSPKNGRK